MSDSVQSEIQELVQRLKNQLQDELIAVYHFGSTAKPGPTAPIHDESDIDLAILSRTPLPKEKILAAMRSVRLDSTVTRPVDLIDLRSADSVIIHQILENGQRIYETDLDAIAWFETTEMAKYCDLTDERKEILEDIRKRGKIHAG